MSTKTSHPRPSLPADVPDADTPVLAPAREVPAVATECERPYLVRMTLDVVRSSLALAVSGRPDLCKGGDALACAEIPADDGTFLSSGEQRAAVFGGNGGRDGEPMAASTEDGGWRLR